MIVTYTPGEGDVQRWEFRLGKFRTPEMKAIEKATGYKFRSTFKQNLYEGDTTARQALLWILQRTKHPTYKLDDVDFADDELEIELQRDEYQELLDGVESAPNITDEQREQAAAVFRAEIERLDAEVEPEGKAPSNDSAPSTGSTLPT